MAAEQHRARGNNRPAIGREPAPVQDTSANDESSDLLGWEGGPSNLISISDGDGVAVMVSGNPRWRDSRLARIAEQDGPGEAIRIAYGEHGDDAIKSVYGSFALCVFDSKRQKLVLAIDRFGIERLCYCLDDNEALTFATSLSSIKCLRAGPTSISNQALFDFIYFHVIPSPDTVYENVRKLEPGQMLTFDRSGVDLSYYWIPDFVADKEASEEDLSAELVKTLETAVERCDFDEHTGCFLSGGLDSSTVTGLAARSHSSKIDAFTIGFDQSGYDEVGFATAAAKHFGANIEVYYVTPEDIAGAIDEIATTYDEPFGNSSAIPTLFCARFAAEHGKDHLLAGDGGDELFAGNERYEKQMVFEYYGRVPGWIKSRLVEPALLGGIGDWNRLTRKARSYIEQAGVSLPERFQTYNTLTVNSVSDVFTVEFLESVNPGHPVSEMERWYERGSHSDLLNRMLFFDWKLTLADNDIRKVNAMCGRENVRVSYPMLDDDLVDFSTKIPSGMKMQRGKLRRFFRDSLSSFLPPEVLSKSKHGFGLPFGEWLKDSLELQNIVNPSLDSLASRGVIERGFIDSLRHKHQHEHASFYGGSIWTLVMLERWLARNS